MKKELVNKDLSKSLIKAIEIIDENFDGQSEWNSDAGEAMKRMQKQINAIRDKVLVLLDRTR